MKYSNKQLPTESNILIDLGFLFSDSVSLHSVPQTAVSVVNSFTTILCNSQSKYFHVERSHDKTVAGPILWTFTIIFVIYLSVERRGL